MINSGLLRKFHPSWTIFQNGSLTFITVIFAYGTFVWLEDGAWENGALPTHGILHMTIGFVGCWGSYFYLLWLHRRYTSNKGNKKKV